MHDMDQCRRKSSCENETLLDSDTQGNSDQTADSIESISDLNKKLELSLYVREKPESNSSEEHADEQNSQPSDFEESGPEIVFQQSSLKEIQISSYESGSREVKTPESSKVVNNEPSFEINTSVHSKKDFQLNKPPRFSRRNQRPDDIALPNLQSFSSEDVKLSSSAYYCNANPTFLSPNVNLLGNQVSAYPREYPEKNLKDSTITYKPDSDQFSTLSSECGQKSTCQNTMPDRNEMKSHQWQDPPTNIRTDVRSEDSFSRSNRTSYYKTKPPIRPNASPMLYNRSSCYKNPVPPFKTNATPISYTQPASRYQNRSIPVGIKENSMQRIQHPRTTTSNFFGQMNDSLDVAQRSQSLTSDEDLKYPAKQSEKSTHKGTDNRNTSTAEKEISVKTKLEAWSKRVDYSKKNILKIDIPTTVPPTSYFPLLATPQRGLLLRPLQRTIIPFPPPSVSGCSGSTFTAGRGTISHLPYQTAGSCAPSYVYSSFPPIVTSQCISQPAQQYNTLINSVSNAGNPMLPAIQPQFSRGQTVQYQPPTQNITAVPHYQDPNNTIFQYGTQYEPAMQNIATDFQYQDLNHPMCQCGTQYDPWYIQSANPQYQNPNYPMCQYGTQYQPSHLQSANPQYQDPNYPMCQYGTQYLPTHIQSANSQYQDPNNLMCQYGTQFRPPIQNLNAEFQYQDPNLMCQYETSCKPPHPQCSYPTYGTSIPSQQQNSNILPIHTFAVNPDSTSMVQNPTWPNKNADQGYHFTDDLNCVPNISDVQTSVENPSTYTSTISVSQYSSGFPASNESTNNILLDDLKQRTKNYQGYTSMDNVEVTDANMYVKWSDSTDDQQEVTIDKNDETSNSQ